MWFKFYKMIDCWNIARRDDVSGTTSHKYGAVSFIFMSKESTGLNTRTESASSCWRRDSQEGSENDARMSLKWVRTRRRSSGVRFDHSLVIGVVAVAGVGCIIPVDGCRCRTRDSRTPAGSACRLSYRTMIGGDCNTDIIPCICIKNLWHRLDHIFTSDRHWSDVQWSILLKLSPSLSQVDFVNNESIPWRHTEEEDAMVLFLVLETPHIAFCRSPSWPDTADFTIFDRTRITSRVPRCAFKTLFQSTSTI